jgi:hypothetical protein
VLIILIYCIIYRVERVRVAKLFELTLPTSQKIRQRNKNKMKEKKRASFITAVRGRNLALITVLLVVPTSTRRLNFSVQSNIWCVSSDNTARQSTRQVKQRANIYNLYTIYS